MEEETKQHKSEAKAATVVILAALIAVAAVAVAVIWLVPKQPASDQSTNGTTESTQQQAADNGDSGTASITFTDEGFSPATLTVKKGTKVTVANKSSQSVQFSSDDHPAHTDDPELNMSVLAPGESGTFTAETVGTHGFHDHIDDSKTGTLVVTE